MSSYDRPQVEALVQTIWDRGFAWGMVDESPPDPHMPRASAMKSRRNSLWAALADIQIAWHRAYIPYDERRALLLVGGMGLTHRLAAFYDGSDRSTITYRFERGIGRLTDYLNGTDHTEWEDEPSE